MRALCCLIAITLPSAALADCPGGAEIFSCDMAPKILRICHVEDNLVYSFGPDGKPELSITAPLKTVEFTPWPGIGSSIWENVTFTNKGYSYLVWTSIMRSPDDPSGLMGGVEVTDTKGSAVGLDCDKDTASNSLDVIYELKVAAGQCWDFDAKAWSSTCD